MTQAQVLSVPSVSLIEGRPATTSLEVAQFFGKRHTDILRDVNNVSGNCPETFSQRNFASAEYSDEQGKPRPMFILYRDGFMLLVMGYTGKKALAMKLAYIEAFNRMEEELEHRKEPVKNLDKLPAPDAPLTPDQQCTLQAIVKAKIDALPPEQRGGLYPKTWSRFNNHFRLAKYCQLPQSRLSEAVAYLTQMDVTESRQALPTAPTAIPAVEEDLAFIRACAREIMERERRMYFALRDTLPPLRGVTRPLALCLHESMDAGSVLLDAALKQLESTARLVLEYARG